MESTDEKGLSAYLHIPFCEKKCIYCDFYSIEDLAPQSEFISLLEREIELKLRSYSEYKGRELSTIFFGGGTPSLLSPDELGRIIGALEDQFTFASDIEFTLECNPGTITPEKLEGYKALGANRLSFGVQSFHADELEFLSRIHDAAQAREAIKLARSAGFDNVNLDLIFALPNQTKEKLRYSLDEALGLETDHISAYNLIVEEGTPLNRMVRLGQVGEMESDKAAELFSFVQETLGGAGFEQYEISNYARSKEKRCKHNLVYWDGFADYISFGPSAHEFLHGTRSWNVSSLDRYGEFITKNELPRINSETPNKDERRTEVLYCQLRSTGIDVERFQREFNENILLHPETDHLLMEGMVTSDDRFLQLTEKGYRYCDAIVVRLMQKQFELA
jgi:oxygen-independent coproporphyrinogen-3 oxidase